MLKNALNWLYWIKKETFESYNPASVYDDLIKKKKYEVTINYERRVASFAHMLNELSIRPARVLDIATGTGALIDALPNKKSATIMGIDISKGMLNIAKKRFAGYKNISFKQEDFIETKFPKKFFNLIAIAYATRFIQQKDEALFAKKIADALASNGLFIAVLNRSFYERFAVFLHRITGFPRGQNMPMNWESYFVKKMKPYLKLKKVSKLKQQYWFVKNIALVFEKK